MFRKLDLKKHVANAAVHPASPLSVDDNHLKDKSARPEASGALFNEIVDGEHEIEYHSAGQSVAVVESNITEDIHKRHRDSEELSLIRNHLAQIETRESNLFDLVQFNVQVKEISEKGGR